MTGIPTIMTQFGLIRVAAAMPRVHLADPAANAREILDMCRQTATQSPSVVVFPELSITGYTCADLFGQNRLLADAERAVAQVVAQSAELEAMIVLGAPLRHAGRLFNCAVVIRAGRILGIVPKTYLAGNGEFYEPRWFASARVLPEAGVRIRYAGQEDVLLGVRQLFRIGDVLTAVEICQDLWVPIPPSSQAALAGAQLLLNLSASNDYLFKHEYRRSLVSATASRLYAAYVYCSCAEGESTQDLVWAGASLICENGSILAEGERFARGSRFICADLDIERLDTLRAGEHSFGFEGPAPAYVTQEAGEAAPTDFEKCLLRRLEPHPFVPQGDPEALGVRCREILSAQVAGLVTRLTTDVTNIQNAFMMTLRMAMRAPASMVVAMVMSFIISPHLASIYLVAVVVLGIFMFFMMSSTSRYFKQVFEKYDAMNESVQENVSAIRVVKAYVREDYENSKFRRAAENIYEMFMRAELRIVSISPVMMAVVYICILSLSWFGANMIVSDTLTTGNLMSLLTYCMNILMSLMMVSMVFIMITMSEASARRIVEVINEKSSLTNPENPVMEVPDGSIRFENVEFSYHPDSAEPVLRDIDLDIRAGESIGIIGGTGSAKSSLVNLVSRLYDVTEGRVLVGGHDVREYDLDVLRGQVAVVLQKNVLFSGTIYDNLRWGDEHATDEECQRACRLACADEFIEKMPEGYNTFIEQGGTNVSGGQKQRLCIARALLKKPKILILDDSTSAVDTETDAKIRRLRDARGTPLGEPHLPGGL